MEEKETQEVQEVRQEKQVDIQQVLDDRARTLGFESWEDMEAKILEEKGRLYELLEKTKKEAEEKEKKYRQEMEKLRKDYEERILQTEVKSKLAGKVVDVEKAFRLLKAEKPLYFKEGKIYAEGEELDRALEKFLQENPFLVKAGETGSGITPQTQPRELSPEEKVKESLKKLIGGK